MHSIPEVVADVGAHQAAIKSAKAADASKTAHEASAKAHESDEDDDEDADDNGEISSKNAGPSFKEEEEPEEASADEDEDGERRAPRPSDDDDEDYYTANHSVLFRRETVIKAKTNIAETEDDMPVSDYAQSRLTLARAKALERFNQIHS